mgnify:CR=1 FL=1
MTQKAILKIKDVSKALGMDKRIGKYFTPIDPMWVFIGAWLALMITILKVSGQI